MDSIIPSTWNETKASSFNRTSYIGLLGETHSIYRKKNSGYSINVIEIDNPEDMLKPWKYNPMFFNIVITHSVTFLFGLVGNVVVVVVMIGDQKTRNATNLFLVSLALADLFLLLVYAPLETLQYFVQQWDESGVVCRMTMYAELLSAIVSVLNLAAVTLERFIVIVFPMKSRSLCTVSNCRKAILLVWFLSMVLTTPVLLTKEVFPITYYNNVTNVTLHFCSEVEQNRKFAIYQLVVLFVAPGTLMTVCYSYVIKELWRSTQKMQILTNSSRINNPKLPHGSAQERYGDMQISNGVHECKISQGNHLTTRNTKGKDARRARKQVIKMLILVIVLFLACWGPRIIMEVIIKFNLHSFTPTTYNLRVTFNLLPFIHACLNPFIYSFMSKNFRRSLQRLSLKMGCKKRSRSGSSSSCKTGPGYSSRNSKLHRGTPTMQRFQRKSGRASTSSNNTNCFTDLTKHAEPDQNPATSAL